MIRAIRGRPANPPPPPGGPSADVRSAARGRISRPFGACLHRTADALAHPVSRCGAALRVGGRTMSTEGPLSREQVFVRPESAGRSATLWIIAGVGAFAVAAAGFVLAVRGRTGPMALQAMTTLPTLLGIRRLTAGGALLPTPP